MAKMVIGQAGKVYGLQRPKAAVAPSIFGADDDDGGVVDPGKAVLSQKHREKMAKRAEKEMAKALAQDASVFDYDGVIDTIHQEREKAEAIVKGAKEKKEVRYVHSLLKVTEQRKKEDEILFEKRLIKELEEEQVETAGTEKFVTSAYKRQLQANKKWAEEKAAEDARVAADDVRKKDGISDFYSNMLRGKNKATGATVRGASPPKEEKPAAAPAPAPQPRDNDEGSGSDHPAAARRPLSSASSPRPSEGSPVPAVRTSLMPSASEAGVTRVPHAAAAAAATDRDPASPASAGRAASPGAAAAEGGAAAAKADGGEAGGEAPGGAGDGDGGAGSKRRYEGWVPTAYGYVREKVISGPAAAAVAAAAEAKKKSEDEVKSVRERYLARKAQRGAGGAADAPSAGGGGGGAK